MYFCISLIDIYFIDNQSHALQCINHNIGGLPLTWLPFMEVRRGVDLKKIDASVKNSVWTFALPLREIFFPALEQRAIG